MPSPTNIPQSVRWWPTMHAREQGGSQVASGGREQWGLLHSSASNHSQESGFCSPPTCPDMRPPLITQCISNTGVRWLLRSKSPMPIRNVEEGNPMSKRPEQCQPGAKAGSWSPREGMGGGGGREVIREEMALKKLDNQHCTTMQIGTNLSVQQMRNKKRPTHPHIRDSTRSFEVILKSICLSQGNVLLFWYVKWKIRSQTSMAPKGQRSKPPPPPASCVSGSEGFSFSVPWILQPQNRDENRATTLVIIGMKWLLHIESLEQCLVCTRHLINVCYSYFWGIKTLRVYLWDDLNQKLS